MFRKELDKLSNYTTPIFDAKIKADANENLLEYPKKLRDILLNSIEDTFEKIRYYPEIDSEYLRNSLATFYGFDKNNFIVSNGSDELIRLIIQATCYQGDYILSTYPCFAMYKISANGLGVEHSSFDLTRDWDLNVDQLVSVAKNISRLKVIFLDTPNNPLGIAYSYEKVEYIVKQLQNVLIVVDNAYGEYCDVDYFSLLKYPNVIITRTFSKLGFAGLRCGYGISSKNNIEQLSKVKPPYNVNIFAQEICAKILENFDLLKENIDTIKSERDKMLKSLSNRYFVLPSQANFVSLIDNKSQVLYESMKEERILVKLFKMTNFKLLRITVGKPENNQVLVNWLLNFKEGDIYASS